MDEKKRKFTVAVHPYDLSTNEYMVTMQNILSERFDVINYTCVKRGMIGCEEVDFLYLNWIENRLDDDDKTIIREAGECGTKVVWVFHNRMQHDSKNADIAMKNIRYMMDVSDTIIIHCRESVEILKLYDPLIQEDKIQYVPHVNYCAVYGNWIEDLGTLLGICQNDFVVGFLGTIRPYKNIELLIDSFKEAVRKTGKEHVKLLIVGKASDEQYKETVIQRINNDPNIIFIDSYINNTVMESFLKVIHILVLPYDIKSSMNSGSMLMAFSYARTVIVSKIAMAADFPEELFYAYDYSDRQKHEKKLTASLENVFENGAETLLSQGKKLQEFVIENHSKEIVSKRIWDIFNHYLQDRSENEIRKDSSMSVARYGKSMGLQYLYDVTYEWLLLEKSKRKLSDFFTGKGIKSIAVYGMGRIGKQVVHDLRTEGITVLYGIDKRGNAIVSDVTVYSSDDVLPETDVIIVTVADFKGVKESLQVTGTCEFMWLIDIIQYLNLINLINDTRSMIENQSGII